MSAEELGNVVGRLLVPILFVVGGYFVARKMNATRAPEQRVKWPIVVGWCLMGLVLLSWFAKAAQAAQVGG